MTFPFRLIFMAYGLAALAAAGSLALGGGALAAVLMFWLGGSAGLFVLPATMAGLRRADPVPEGFAAWEADLAAERADSRRAAMLAAWEADGAAEQAAAAADRRGTDRRAG